MKGLNYCDQTYTYDTLNRTASVTNGSTATSFQYNAEGQRLRKTTGNATVNSIWDGGQIAFDYTNSNGTISKNQYIQGTGADGVIKDGTIYFNALDVKGNVLTSSMDINSIAKYDAYGNVK